VGSRYHPRQKSEQPYLAPVSEAATFVLVSPPILTPGLAPHLFSPPPIIVPAEIIPSPLVDTDARYVDVYGLCRCDKRGTSGGNS
jgi:hypothetical protein